MEITRLIDRCRLGPLGEPRPGRGRVRAENDTGGRTFRKGNHAPLRQGDTVLLERVHQDAAGERTGDLGACHRYVQREEATHEHWHDNAGHGTPSWKTVQEKMENLL